MRKEQTDIVLNCILHGILLRPVTPLGLAKVCPCIAVREVLQPKLNARPLSESCSCSQESEPLPKSKEKDCVIQDHSCIRSCGAAMSISSAGSLTMGDGLLAVFYDVSSPC